MSPTPTYTKMARPERAPVMSGRTWKRRIDLPDGRSFKIYITICDLDNAPFELFINTTAAEDAEQLRITALLASILLQSGYPAEELADQLKKVASPFTSHSAGANGQCPSLMARIGETVLDHIALNAKSTEGGVLA